MTRYVSFLFILCCARGATAGPDRGSVAGGVLLGVDHFLNAAWLLDGSVRLGRLPLALHASAAKGQSIDADSGGNFWRAMAGIEGRLYRESGGFGFAALDGGYQHQTWNPSDPVEAEEHRGPLIVVRGGYEGGGEHLRVRAALELYRYHREFVDHMTTWDTGVGITAGVGYRF